jgi:hypothetical protein
MKHPFSTSDPVLIAVVGLLLLGFLIDLSYSRKFQHSAIIWSVIVFTSLSFLFYVDDRFFISVEVAQLSLFGMLFAAVASFGMAFRTWVHAASWSRSTRAGWRSTTRPARRSSPPVRVRPALAPAAIPALPVSEPIPALPAAARKRPASRPKAPAAPKAPARPAAIAPGAGMATLASARRSPRQATAPPRPP